MLIINICSRLSVPLYLFFRCSKSVSWHLNFIRNKPPPSPLPCSVQVRSSICPLCTVLSIIILFCRWFHSSNSPWTPSQIYLIFCSTPPGLQTAKASSWSDRSPLSWWPLLSQTIKCPVTACAFRNTLPLHVVHVSVDIFPVCVSVNISYYMYR